MHAGLADHVVHKGHVIDTSTERRDDLAKPLAALAVGLELPHRFLPRAKAILKSLHLLAEIRLLAVVLDQRGLVIEEVNVAGRPAHEELHHPLRFGGQDLRAMRGLRCLQ